MQFKIRTKRVFQVVIQPIDQRRAKVMKMTDAKLRDQR